MIFFLLIPVLQKQISITKGQEISTWNCGVSNFPKIYFQKSLISALASKKWLNQKNEDRN